MADQTLRRADDLLTELTEVVETARSLPMSSSCVLPREHLLDLLDELREVLPPEMDEARTLIARRDKVMKQAREAAAELRQSALTEADAVLADARHQADHLLHQAERQSAEMRHEGEQEHARLVGATAVHEAAVAAAATLREEAERYQARLAAEAQDYDARTRRGADEYAKAARVDAERYATKLTADAEDYAESTLDELATVLQRAASTADQGRTALAHRRAAAYAAGAPQAQTA